MDDLQEQLDNMIANCALLQEEIARLELEKHVLLVACEGFIKALEGAPPIIGLSVIGRYLDEMRRAVALVRKGK